MQGHESAPDTWELLIRDRNREKNWDDAVKRREQLNRFCSFVAKWPNLARAYKHIHSSIRKSIDSPRVKLFEITPTIDPLQAALSNTESSTADSCTLSLDIHWGAQQIIELAGVRTINFSVETCIFIYYSYGDHTGVMTTDDSWDFQPSEGAVLLTFIDGNYNEHEDFDSTIQNAKSISTIVLLPK
ncbi:hypothetical protein Q4506_00645 [Colwellia sp. 4_MG-2023]|uniref:hypothetical protein n=1 Tax=unclassified Colwellia TaxID=196834 RepID=UPI0026E37EBA|nr:MULTISPECIES: hypothetical protein [unclassified Colwellia]MDO6505541.1 hypothetical protein [Colwellia sp. 5_MG-2023]MDO6554163.1 hypothetical protein [Colwellia sp. 4_MG-2023]